MAAITSTGKSYSPLLNPVEGRSRRAFDGLSGANPVPSTKASSAPGLSRKFSRSFRAMIAEKKHSPEQGLACFDQPGNRQSQCPDPSHPLPLSLSPSPPGTGVGSIITPELYDEMLPHRATSPCEGAFYTYDSFITAANSFPQFGTVGDEETRKRELAAFFGQTSWETAEHWSRCSSGYCWIREQGNPSEYCQSCAEWPCVAGQKYYGRGPIQLTFNFNYGPVGAALGLDLLSDPDLVATDPVISFKAAIWFWMNPRPPKPSCHDLMIGNWSPSQNDLEANCLPGYGVTTNIINCGECGHGYNKRVNGRIEFYKRYCDILGVSCGDNLDCYNQKRFTN